MFGSNRVSVLRLAGAVGVFQACALFGANPPEWESQYERVENGPEGDLAVRVGDVDNLGFGWGEGDFDPFSGAYTGVHTYPWEPEADDAEGTDRIMVGTGVKYPRPDDAGGDGYSTYVQPPASTPRSVKMELGAVPEKIDAVLVQLFIDDFQSPTFESTFQVKLDGKRVARLERVFEAIDQTGPVGQLTTLRLDPAHFDDLRDGVVELMIDDPTTGAGDGYALDFVRVLVNPKVRHPVRIEATVIDKVSGEFVEKALVTAALSEELTNAEGLAVLTNVPAGYVAVEASKTGYKPGVGMVDVDVTEEWDRVTIYLEPIIPGKLKVELDEATAQSGGVAPGAALIIFDASGSMLKRMDGGRRIDIAKATLSAVVGEVLPDGLNVALRVFGEGGPDSCESVLRIPLGTLDREELRAAVTSIQPVNLSKTPIGASLNAAAEDLAAAQGAKLVLLITDGEETCGGDPKAAIEALAKQGLDVRVNIVGFAIDDAALKQTFADWARAGRGDYFDAASAEGLSDALRGALATPFKVLDAGGNVIATGTVGGEEINLPEGTFTVVAGASDELKAEVQIAPGETTTTVLGQK